MVSGGEMLPNGEGIEAPSISVVAGAGEESSSVRRSSMVAGAGEGCFGLVITVALSESEVLDLLLVLDLPLVLDLLLDLDLDLDNRKISF